MKSLGTHIELVREVGLDRRIRRAGDYDSRRAVQDIVLGGLIGFALIGVLHVAGAIVEGLTR